ncbi:MAG: hypothetical protein JWM47_4115, partial [Acidimicrobiales bacterium]|nr:hypothetical protein [Acidimicrobiales bacterium]
YRGAAAKLRGCPPSGAVDRLPALHPVLFRNTGFSHHPYELTFSPSTKPPEPSFYTMANLKGLSHTLRFAYLRYGRHVPSTGVPLYLSEYGYQTNPPDRIGVSPAKQADYLAEAEYLAWRDPAVRAFSQYLLNDNGAPISKTFQTGLLYADGKPKPAYQGYKLPIWLPKHHGRSVTVWGLVRPAPNGTAPAVTIEFRRNGAKRYATLATPKASAARGYVYTKVRVPGSGRIRLNFGGQFSRSLRVSVR